MRSRLWVVALVLFAWLVYWFFMSAGGLARWPVYGTYIDLMAEGFRKGQLNLPIEPAPELLRAADPYSSSNSRYWALDATYYAGKYYGYWGPVPALFQWAGKSLLGIRRIIGDHYVSLFHLCIGAWAGILVVERMGRKLFAGISRKLVALGAVAFAFGNPTLHGATTAGTYNAAIIAAQAWLLVGLLPAMDAVFLAEEQRRRTGLLVLAGCAWSLCLASRVALGPALAALVVATALLEALSFRGRRLQRCLGNALALGIPLATTSLALLVYNKVRFDDWLQFGIKLQLSAYPYRVGTEFIVANLYAYALRPFETSCEFPYVFQVWRMGQDAFPQSFSVPRGYMILEPVIGWLRAVPLTWLLPFALLCLPRPFDLRRRDHRTYVWCVACFGALAALGGVGSLPGYSSTMRYLHDVSNGLALLALVAAFALKAHRIGTSLLPRATSSLIALLLLATVVFGVLIGYQGYAGHFARYNPKLHAAITSVLSVCGDRAPRLPAFQP